MEGNKMSLWYGHRHRYSGVESILRTLDPNTMVDVYYQNSGRDFDIRFIEYDPVRKLAFFFRPGIDIAVEVSDIVAITTPGYSGNQGQTP
jgi:hypothetical protein